MKPLQTVLNRWASGFEDRDNKFNQEFQITFNSSFWELYIFQCLKDINCQVDFSKPSPDFCVTDANGLQFNIEAVTANHSIDEKPEWAQNKLKDNETFLNHSSVRLLNAIESKHKKFLNNYSKMNHVKNIPFIIAIAPFDQYLTQIQNNEAINRVLYAQGIDKYNNFKVIKTAFATKNNGTNLELGIFTNDKYKHISAIIFSTMATFGKVMSQATYDCTVRTSRYHEEKGLLMDVLDNREHFETHLDGLQVHHNPFAEHPLNSNIFDQYEVSHYYYDTVSQKIDNQQKSYTMISRNVYFE